MITTMRVCLRRIGLRRRTCLAAALALLACLSAMGASGARAEAAEPLPFRPPAPGTVLRYNGVDYVFGRTEDRITRLSIRYRRPATRVTLHLHQLLLNGFRQVRNQKARFDVKVANPPLWPLKLGGRYGYSWTSTVDGKPHGKGRGEIRVFSGFEKTDAAGREWRTVLIVKEQTWTNPRGDRMRSRQNLFYAPALGFFVREERYFFRNGTPLPPVVLTLRSIRRR